MTRLFDRGDDIRIEVDGAALGGVISLVRTNTVSTDKIQEFLTCEPVAELPERSWALEFTANGRDGSVFDGDISEITVYEARRTVRYSGCTVTSLKSEAQPRGDVLYCAAVTALERSVTYE